MSKEESKEQRHKDNVEEASASEEDDHFFNEKLKCRFYRKDFPEENDLVIVLFITFYIQIQTTAVKLNENGAYVVLLEYENMEGFILQTEVTKKRVKSVNKFIKIGKQETMMVIRVDKEKRYIDLSKKKVQPEEATQCELFFKNAKMVHNIMKQTAVKLDCTLIELYEQFGWDLYDKFEHAYNAFKLAMSDPERVFAKIKITEEQKKALLDNISKKMAPQPVKIRADFELTCFTYEGIDALKEALLTAKREISEENFEVHFKMIAPPHYKCETTTLEKAKGIAKLEAALTLIEKVIKEKKGTFKLVNKPQIIGKDSGDEPGKINNNEDEESSEEEDNEEGIDIDLEDDEEEKKEEPKKDKKKAKKKVVDSDDDDSN